MNIKRTGLSKRQAAAICLALWLPALLVPSVASAGVYTGTVAEATDLAELVNASDYSEDAQGNLLRLYRAFFDREPDIGGAQYWIDINDQGQTLDQIADFFTLSTEFANNYDGSTNSEYLEAVYTNVLGRDFDQEGFDYWLNFLHTNELTRGGVVRWISANNEFIGTYPYASNPDIDLGEWFTTAPAEIDRDQQTFDVTNRGDFTHEFVIVRGASFADLPKLGNGAVDEATLGTDVLGRTSSLGGGETAQIEFDLEPGSYVFLCNIGTHAALGMEMSVTVN